MKESVKSILLWAPLLLTVSGASEPASLEDYLTRVLKHNEQLQDQIIEYEISQQVVEGSKGAFEPELVVSGEYQDTDRPNNAEEIRNLGGVQFFTQRQELYSAAVETLLVSGAQARFGMDVRRINNNLQQARLVDQEWSTFFGLSFVQPLLKGAGPDSTLLPFRIASMESDQAYQEFRRQSMVILTGAEMAFWNLYFAQQQRAFAEDSFKLATALYEDTVTRESVGKATELNVLEAQVAISAREASVGVAEQALIESQNAFLYFMGEDPGIAVGSLSPPDAARPQINLHDCLNEARVHNPQYIFRERQIQIERARLRYAANQQRPNLDLRASFGVTGLSDSLGDSLHDIGQGKHPTWSVGMEFRLPLGGGKSAKSHFTTAKLRERQAKIQLNQLQTELRGAVHNGLQKVLSTWKNVESYQRAVSVNHELLNAELEKLKLGKASNQDTLEAEEELAKSRNLELSNLILHKRAHLELEVLMGVVLINRGIDFSRKALNRRTAEIVREFFPHEMTDEEIESFQRFKDIYHKAIPTSP